MRPILLSVIVPIVSIAACGTSNDSPNDAGTSRDTGSGIDAAIRDAANSDANIADAETDANLDAASDADGAPDAATCPKTLLVGGTDIARQGWSISTMAPATLSYIDDTVVIQTTTTAGARTSGQMLLSYPGAVEVGKPFTIRVVMLVESVSTHNQYDSAAAILGSFGGGAGSPTDRAQMIYLDNAAIGWADDTTPAFPAAVTNGTYHTYELSVDAANVARVTVDGVAALTRNGFSTNGTIAIGDQTNDPNVDSTIRIRSVTKLCP